MLNLIDQFVKEEVVRKSYCWAVAFQILKDVTKTILVIRDEGVVDDNVVALYERALQLDTCE